jgi:RND family efflux transporter MFP subunit
MKSLFAYLLIASISFVTSAQNYELEQVSVAPYEKSIKRAGKVAFKRTLKLSFKSSGYLKKLSVDEGDFFSIKQLLASLNTEELIAEKNSRYAQLLQAKREFNRSKKLLEQELSSEQALEVAQTNVETRRESYQVSYYNLEKAEIYAPFDGVVLARFSELAEFQSPGREVLEVAAINKNLVVKVKLTDSEISFVKLGQEVQVDLPNIGRVKGVISKVPVTSNTDGQLYLIEVLLENIKAGQGVVAGQLAQVTINFATESSVYQVPIGALIEIDENGSAVLLTKSGSERFIRQSFDVLNIDTKSIYLRAQSHNETIEFVTNGWQQLKISEL